MRLLDWLFGRGRGKPGSSPSHVAKLIECLGSGNEEKRKRALASLVAIGQATVEPLIQALRSDVWNVKMNAAIALGQIGDPRAVEPLIWGLGEDIRIQAIVALGEIGDGRAESPLREALGDPNEGARAFAAEALDKLGHREPLIEALDDPCDFVQRSSIQALAKSGDATAIIHISRPLRKARDWATRYLVALLVGSEERVKKAVAGALRDITGQELGEDYLKWKESLGTQAS